MKKIRNLIPITYHAYARDPFPPDATGYVPEDKLLDMHDERYTYWDKNDEIQPRAGFRLVGTPKESDYQGYWYAVRLTNIYTLVTEDERLDTGWGANYPGGGSSSVSPATHQDEDENLYIRMYWG